MGGSLSAAKKPFASRKTVIAAPVQPDRNARKIKGPPLVHFDDFSSMPVV
jgi:hypothetical protein